MEACLAEERLPSFSPDMTDSARCTLAGDNASNLGAKQEALNAKSICAASVESRLQRVEDGTVIVKRIYETRPKGRHVEVGIHFQQRHHHGIQPANCAQEGLQPALRSQEAMQDVSAVDSQNLTFPHMDHPVMQMLHFLRHDVEFEGYMERVGKLRQTPPGEPCNGHIRLHNGDSQAGRTVREHRKGLYESRPLQALPDIKIHYMDTRIVRHRFQNGLIRSEVGELLEGEVLIVGLISKIEFEVGLPRFHDLDARVGDVCE